MRLSNKKVVITAAASGIGRAGALLFEREGAQVVAIDINAQGLQELSDEAGGTIEAIVADLSQPNSVGEAIERAAALLGCVDVLWSHAGINGPSDIENLDMAAYQRTMALNVDAMVVACGRVAPLMSSRGGSVVLTASVAGLVGSIQNPIYSASKFAVVGLAKSLALRYAPQNIRVNSICPGPVDSAMLQDLAAGRSNVPDGPAIAERLLASIPLARFARPDEIAEAALWLASDAASFVTGIALPVDGGVTAR